MFMTLPCCVIIIPFDSASFKITSAPFFSYHIRTTNTNNTVNVGSSLYTLKFMV